MAVETLVARLDSAVAAGSIPAITSRVKSTLEQVLVSGTLRLADRFRQVSMNHYARRLLHRDRELRYTVVAMAWAPGQHTSLHDHAGIWCVEGVAEGMVEVTRFKLVERIAGRYRFASQPALRETMGSAGCLIPPSEYHVVSNALPDLPSVTLHVYGGELLTSNTFQEVGNGWYERQTRALSYDE